MFGIPLIVGNIGRHIESIDGDIAFDEPDTRGL